MYGRAGSPRGGVLRKSSVSLNPESEASSVSHLDGLMSCENVQFCDSKQ